MTAGWTLSELVAHAAQALAANDVRAPNGRVTELPDARVIRWYATIGLVDRPSAMRGRTALYGPRHLLQLVAVKRRQAQGSTLAEIQRELAGATNATLRRVAGMAAQAPLLSGAGPATTDATDAVEIAIRLPARPRRPAKSDTSRSAGRFWARPAGQQTPAGSTPHARDATNTIEDAMAGATVGFGLHAIPLSGDVLLLLHTTPGADDVAAIRAAAQPLVEVLVHRGLVASTPPGAHKTGAHEPGAHEPGAHKTGAHKTGAHKTGAHKTGAHKTAAHKTAAHKTGAQKTGAEDGRAQNADVDAPVDTTDADRRGPGASHGSHATRTEGDTREDAPRTDAGQ